MELRLTREQAQTITAHARAASPREACGLIAGRGAQAIEVLAVPNAAADPIHSYYMDERHLVEALTHLDARSLELIGLYHSHPISDPIPSQTDVRQASYPDTPYLIVGLKGGEARLAAWTMRAGQVSEVRLLIGAEPAEHSPSLSDAQKIAILLSALIAFVLLIVVSLSLLPPAPLH